MPLLIMIAEPSPFTRVTTSLSSLSPPYLSHSAATSISSLSRLPLILWFSTLHSSPASYLLLPSPSCTYSLHRLPLNYPPVLLPSSITLFTFLFLSLLLPIPFYLRLPYRFIFYFLTSSSPSLPLLTPYTAFISHALTYSLLSICIIKFIFLLIYPSQHFFFLFLHQLYFHPLVYLYILLPLFLNLPSS